MIWYDGLRYDRLCCTMLCYDMLWSAMICYAMLWYGIGDHLSMPHSIMYKDNTHRIGDHHWPIVNQSIVNQSIVNRLLLLRLLLIRCVVVCVVVGQFYSFVPTNYKTQTRPCTSDGDCDGPGGDMVCWWLYDGCNAGQCMCDPRTHVTHASGRCLRGKRQAWCGTVWGQRLVVNGVIRFRVA